MTVESIWPAIEPLLDRVQKPARYIGCEDGRATIEHGADKVAWLLVYPDTYEIGLPNAGLQILYEILNERADAVAERSYTPWADLAVELRRRACRCSASTPTVRPGRSTSSPSTWRPSSTYTNVLETLDLAGVPIRQADRADDDPLVIVGGHCTFNPEPLADFVDAVALGDGEEVVGEITDVIGAAAASAAPTSSAGSPLCAACTCLRSTPSRTGRARPVDAAASPTVEKRTIHDLAAWPYPKNQLVPLTEVVHDRLNVEVFRGCTRGCRFCQAGMITRPVRERPAEQVRTMITDGLKRTGYDDVSLTSLSTADYSGIEDVVGALSPPAACAPSRPRSACRASGSTPSPSASPPRSPR